MNKYPAAEAALSHAGAPLEESRIFTAPPPPEIGAVQSAFSSQRAGRVDIRGWLIALSSAIGLGLITTFAFTVEFHLPAFLTYPAGAILGILVIVGLIPRPVCTYVGERGLARVMPSSAKPAVSTFLFAPGSTVTVELTRVRVNGIYSGTEFAFLFSTASTGRTFRVAGKYYERRAGIPADNVWHFGAAGERALADFLLPDAISRIDHGNTETFRLRSGIQIDLGPESMTIWKGDTRTAIPYRDLTSVEADQGELTIHGKSGTAGFTDKGKEAVFTFIYAQMPNARVFFFLLQRQIAAATPAVATN